MGLPAHPVHLSDAFPAILSTEFNPKSPDATRQLQNMGDELRGKLGPKVLAHLAAYLIAEERRTLDVVRIELPGNTIASPARGGR